MKGADTSIIDKESPLSKAWAEQMAPLDQSLSADLKRDQELALGEKPKEMIKEVDRLTNMLGKFIVFIHVISSPHMQVFASSFGHPKSFLIISTML